MEEAGFIRYIATDMRGGAIWLFTDNVEREDEDAAKQTKSYQRRWRARWSWLYGG